MTATITNPQRNGRNHADKKETVRTLKLVAYSKGELHNPITIRWYMGRSNSASTVYCSIWCHNKHVDCAGNGSASGWGYHKESAALGYAIQNAGIKLDKSIDGVGDSAIREAVEAIAKMMGYRGKMIIV